MSNKLIDDFLRDGMAGYQPEYNPDDWAAMEKMLDKQKSIRPIWMKYVVPVAASLMLLLSGGVAGYFYHQQTNNNNLTALDSNNATENTTNATASAGAGTGAGFAGLSEKIVSHESESKRNIALSSPVAVSEFKEFNTVIAQNFSESTTTDFSTVEDLIRLQNVEASALYANLNLLPEHDKKEILTSGKNQDKFSIGVHVSPDFNMMNKVKVGYSAGVSAEYRISPSVSISSGVTYTNMEYSKQNYNEYTAAPYQTDATFQLVGIPVEATYHFNSESRIQPFVSAGVINYFPLREEYNFTYNKYSSTPLTTNGNNFETTVDQLVATSYSSNVYTSDLVDNNTLNPTSTSTAYKLKPYFGIVKIGAGVNYQVSPKVKLQLSPHIKMPLTGMGLEEIEVNTVGFNTGLIYSI